MANMYSDLTLAIINGSGNVAKNYIHKEITTAHLFISLLSTMKKNTDNPESVRSYSKFKDILNKYNVTGKSFESSFLMFFPRGEIQEGENFKITYSREFNNLIQNINRNATREQRTQEVEDLIMELFSDPSFDLERILEDVIGSEVETRKMYEEILKTFKPKTATEIKELEGLDELTNLNKWVLENPQHLIGCEENIKKVVMGLAGRAVRSTLLTGPAGTGKTSIVYRLAELINEGNVPEFLKDKIIYEVNQAALVAGTRYRGDLEEKIQKILSVVIKNKNVILFIDELHSFLGLGAGSEDGDGCGNLIKPYLTRGELQIIGATTNEEYTKFILPDKAFASRFHECKVEEPSTDEMREILKGILPTESEYFKKEIQEELVEEVIKYSKTFAIEYANPRKAINMLELACAYARAFEEEKKEVDLNAVIESMKIRYNIYISQDKIKDTRKELFDVLLGQDDALNRVLKNLTIVENGICDDNKPKISMLLCGPTGTGKTETAKIIAKKFFGSESALIKINMGEYSTETDVTKLAGASAGYVGYDTETELIKGVRQHPQCVVLFDEIEKAHKSVQKILLNILDEGEMKDNKGNRVSFKNSIIIFTTNLGCTKDTGKATGMGFLKTTTNNSESTIMKAIEDYFSPEFLGRLDDIVFYNSLSKDIAASLVNRYLKEYNEKAELDIKFTDEDVEDVIKLSEIEIRGARGIRKQVRKKIVDILTEKQEVTI